jgi:hypothetical protein
LERSESSAGACAAARVGTAAARASASSVPESNLQSDMGETTFPRSGFQVPRGRKSGRAAENYLCRRGVIAARSRGEERAGAVF